MDLIKQYLYLTSPIRPDNIDKKTFVQLKEHNWFTDSRGSQDFQILNKRFNIDGQWYRTMIRFEKRKDNSDSYSLNAPVPFVIAKTNSTDGFLFVDEKVYTGRKVKHALGYLDEGIPLVLLDAVIEDLNNHVIYID